MIPLLLLMNLHMLATVTPVVPSILPWFPIALILSLIVIVVAALIYVLAPIMNSTGMQQWARFQIYEAFLSIALIVIFLALVGLLYLNPQQALSSVSLVPNGCNSNANPPVNTIYTLSACDLSQFNTAAYTLGDYMYAFTYIKGLFGSYTLTIQPFPQEDGVDFGATIPNILDPISTSMLTYVLDAILAALLLSQIQLVLLSSALMLMSLCFAVGLICRVFGISRSFGGGMIALGVGIGIVYPLLIGVTYGYVDVAANTYCLSSVSQSLSCIGGAAGSQSFQYSFFSVFLGPFSSVLSPFVPTSGATLAAGLTWVIDEIGYILAGLIVIPVLNVILVDIFVVDFSKAIGEQMSFSMLFTQVV